MECTMNGMYGGPDAVSTGLPNLIICRTVITEVISERDRTADKLRAVGIRMLPVVYRMNVTVGGCKLRDVCLIPDRLLPQGVRVNKLPGPPERRLKSTTHS